MDNSLQIEYFKKIQKADDDANALQTANKIYDELERIHKNTNSNSRRRWIWELLQNAKDLHEEGIRVDILIDLDDNCFTFAHNAKNFTIGHLTNLIKQVSSKDRSKDHINTGKFGTGFLSTHLLSKKVEIRGILDTEELGTLIGFSVLMDRQAQTRDELRAKIETTLESRRNILDLESLNVIDRSAFNTSFIYYLDEGSHPFAISGLKDLTVSLPYALVFLQDLGQIEISHESIIFYKNGAIDLGEIHIHKIIKVVSGKSEIILIGELKDGETSIAFELIESQDGFFSVKKMPNDLPKLFCDFPLVGTEDFGLPFVLNSPKFDPTEARNGVFLTDFDKPDIIENKRIIGHGIELYSKVLEILSSYQVNALYNICGVGKFADKEWMSSSWCELNIKKPLVGAILHTPIVRNINGILTPFLGPNEDLRIVIPAAKEVNRYEIYNLLSGLTTDKLNPEMLPAYEEFEHWYAVLNEDILFVDVYDLSEMISDLRSLDLLIKSLSKEIDCYYWLNKFYEILVGETSSYARVKSSPNKEHGIFLNQNGDFVHHSLLKIDSGISENLKELAKLFEIDQRNGLLDTRIIVTDSFLFDAMGDQDILIKILHSLTHNSSFTIESLLFTSSLIHNQADATPRQKILQIFGLFFGQSILPKGVNLEVTNLIQLSDKRLLTHITTGLSKLENLNEVSEFLDADDNVTIKFIDDLVNYLDQNGFESFVGGKVYPIIPNQNGKFCKRNELYFDSGLNKELLDILLDFGVDIREQLMHTNISLPVSERDSFSYQVLSGKINELISPLVGLNVHRSSDQEENLVKLYQWLISHSVLAENNLGEIFAKKHILLSDTVISKKLEKSEKYDKLINVFEKSGISEEDLLKTGVVEMLQKMLWEEHNKNRDLKIYHESPAKNFIDSTEDFIGCIVASGIHSQKDFENMLQRFGYKFSMDMIAIDWPNKLEFVHRILRRAVKNVLEYLKSDPRYDLTDLREDSITTFSGAKYCELPINLVIRPNDYRKVIIYYWEELELLKRVNTQFWVDNDKIQRQLTIGDIIQALRAGIIENLD